MPTATAPPKRTQAERTALSESRILRAAMRLIARRGYTGTTLADIGEAAGYSRGLAGHRFGSKQGLLRALVEHAGGRFVQDQISPALEGRSGVDALAVIVDSYVNEIVVREERLHALYVLMGEALGPVPEIRHVFVEFNSAFRGEARKAIENGIRAGTVRRDVDAAVEAALFVGMLRGVAMQWVTDPKCFDLDAVRASIKATLVDHLSPRVAKRAQPLPPSPRKSAVAGARGKATMAAVAKDRR